MTLVFSIALLAASVIGVFFYLEKMSPEGDTPEVRRWLRTWAIKGLGGPIFLWMFINLGLFSRLPSLMPALDFYHGWAKVGAYNDVSAIGIFVIATYWVGLTFAWMLALLGQQIEHRKDFATKILIWSIFLLPIALGIVKVCGWSFGGVAAAAWFTPMACLALPMIRVEKVQPMYNRAIVKMQFDRYEEAEEEVLKQLEKCEDDFEGWMMLAELYANHFHDVSGAARIIHETCSQDGIAVSNLAIAYHRLADWHLKLGDDPDSARQTLLLICERLPGSHLARMAKLRIDQLPANQRELLEQRKVKTIRLPALSRHLDDPANVVKVDAGMEDPVVQANRCVERLKANPDNITVREEFARVLAERLNKVQAGLDQLELLLNLQNQPPLKRAEWMGLLAAWHLRYRQDEPTAKKILQRLRRDFPETPQAFAAQRRLNLMEVEERMRQQRLKFTETISLDTKSASPA